MKNNEELRRKILDGTQEIFKEKGLKFTMDDIAKKLKISKKTIYTVYDDKENLFFDMVDYIFDHINEKKQEIIRETELDYTRKIVRVMTEIPERYKDVDFAKLDTLSKKYPRVYDRVRQRLESNWEETIKLLNMAMDNNSIRRINIPILRTMVGATLAQFFSSDVLAQNNMTYSEALRDVTDILLLGIKVEPIKEAK